MERLKSSMRLTTCREQETRRTSWRHSLPARTFSRRLLLDRVAGEQQFKQFIIHVREIAADDFQRRAKLVGSDYQGFIDFAKRFVYVNLQLLVAAGVVFGVAVLFLERLDGCPRIVPVLFHHETNCLVIVCLRSTAA